MKSCNILLPSLPLPPHREWVVISPSTALTKSTTLKSVRVHGFMSRNSMEGASERGTKTAAPKRGCHMSTAASGVSLDTAVEMNTGE